MENSISRWFTNYWSVAGFQRNKLYEKSCNFPKPQIYREIRSKTHTFKTSFPPNAIESWNNVIINFHGNFTFRKLKIHLLCFMRPMYKRVLNIHDPKGVKYLFQVRMNLCPLSSHKNHNIADTPSNICACNQGIADNRHFLFECLKFATQQA